MTSATQPPATRHLSLLSSTFRLLREHLSGKAKPATLRLVCATRLSEADFWAKSPLGQSLKPWLSDRRLSVAVSYSNTQGLHAIYNPHLSSLKTPDALLFIHDDVRLFDEDWLSKTLEALAQFDVVGVAGNTRISPLQPAWAFRCIENRQLIWDDGHLSGEIWHGTMQEKESSFYGPAPAACELLDGVFIAVRQAAMRRHGLVFDSRFNFHFYDMDFCRSVRQVGLTMGTWPIALLHESQGGYGSPIWTASAQQYFAKWKS